MELIESKEGINYFKILWSVRYQHVQQTFFQCVESGDPNTLTGLLQYHPYHVDSMLQLCEACKMTGQLDMALDFIERILYKFETCWHTLFRPTRYTNNRLEYKHPENRSFLIALFRHIQMLDRRGCSRTALEVCKFLLNLDHSDPLGVLLMIDTFAIRSRECQFLLDLSFSTQFEENLTCLPNFMYSTALAKFYIKGEKPSEEEKIPKKGLASDRSLLSPTELLENAIFLFPGVIPPLLTKMGIDRLMVTINGERVNAIEHPFFLESLDFPTLRPLMTLYLIRNYQLWKVPEATEWLKDTVKLVLCRAVEGDPMVENGKTMVKEMYQEEVISHHIHYLLSEISEVIDTLPPHLSRGGLEIYDRADAPRPGQGGPNPNPFALFLRSLLPWGDPLQPQQPGGVEWVAGLLNQLGLGGGAGEGGDGEPT